MSGSELQGVLRRKPFVPFRIVTSDGTCYDIDHPDRVFVTLSTAIVGYPDNQSPPVNARYDYVSLRHIVRLELAEGVAEQHPTQGAAQE